MTIKYTGSKRWLADILLPMEEVYEPFAGSAVVSFTKSKVCHLNDQSAPLIEFYRAISQNRDKFMNDFRHEVWKIKNSKDSKAAYYDARDRYNKTGMTDPVLFCIIIYLGFNGLYRVGPNGCNVPYGGDSRKVNEAGLLSIPVEKIASLSSMSWDSRNPPNDECVVYADPPYATAFTGYTKKGWSHEDNIALFTDLSKRPNPVLISCLQTDDNEKLLASLGLDFVTLDKKYTNGRGSIKKTEILAFNKKAIPYIVFRKVVTQ